MCALVYKDIYVKAFIIYIQIILYLCYISYIIKKGFNIWLRMFILKMHTILNKALSIKQVNSHLYGNPQPYLAGVPDFLTHRL